MKGSHRGRNTIANLLIVGGMLILVGLGGYFGWQSYRGQQLRDRLAQTPAPVALSQTPLPSTPTPSPTAVATLAAPSVTPTIPSSPTAPAATSASPGVTSAPPPRATAAPLPTATPAPTAVPTVAPTSAVSGAPVRIVIPDLKLDVPIVEMGWDVVQTADGPQSEWLIPQNEAGHHLNSAQLGEADNIVLSGHNNIYGRVFEAISLAWPGEPAAVKRVDDFTDQADLLNGRVIQLFDAAGKRYDYTVQAFYRLKDLGVPLAQRIANARFMEPTTEAKLTIVTCWPIWSNTHRLVLVAKPATPR